MSALYYEPKLRDFGLADYGWRGFGGMLTNHESGENIPQYNLAAYWKRPIAPVISGFVEPILPPRPIKVAVRRPPGNFRSDMDSTLLTNVNLLAVRRQSVKKMALWTTSEYIGQNLIQEFKIKVKDGVLSSDDKICCELSMESPIQELRVCHMNSKELWVRCKRHLSVVKPSTAEIVRVFRSSVQCFEENVLLPGNVTLCDMGGMVWNGPVGSPLSRTKSYCSDIKALSHSDHPRVVFASSDYEVRTLDLRLDSVINSTVIFSVPELSKKGALENAAYVPDRPVDRPHIQHIRSLPEHPHNIFIITSHSAYLCDDRFPKNPILQLPHTIPYGSHVLLPTSPVADPQGNGHVVSVYLLDHLLTDVSVSRLYIHENEIWSSILPIHLVGSCSDINKTMRYSLYNKDRVARYPVMGMAVVQEYQDDCGRPTDFLLRALSDGSIWFQSMRYGKIQSSELKEMWLLSRKRVEHFFDNMTKKEEYGQRLPDGEHRPEFSLSTKLDVALEVSELPSKYNSWNPLRKEVYKECQAFELLQASHPEAVLPSIINDVWKDSMDKMGVS